MCHNLYFTTDTFDFNMFTGITILQLHQNLYFQVILMTNDGNQTLWRMENEQHSDWVYAQVNSLLLLTLYRTLASGKYRSPNSRHTTQHTLRMILYTIR